MKVGDDINIKSNNHPPILRDEFGNTIETEYVIVTEQRFRPNSSAKAKPEFITHVEIRLV